eukprot:COSAG01_NODE_12618_length_1709_cov_3.080074_1_plen_485_part_01
MRVGVPPARSAALPVLTALAIGASATAAWSTTHTPLIIAESAADVGEASSSSNSNSNSSSNTAANAAPAVGLALQLAGVALQALAAGPHVGVPLGGVEAGGGELGLRSEEDEQEEREEDREWRLAVRQVAAGLVAKKGRLSALLAEPAVVGAVQLALRGARCTGLGGGGVRSAAAGADEPSSEAAARESEQEPPVPGAPLDGVGRLPARAAAGHGAASPPHTRPHAGGREQQMRTRQHAAGVAVGRQRPPPLDALRNQPAPPAASSTASWGQRNDATAGRSSGGSSGDAAALLAAFEVEESDRGAWAAALTGWRTAAAADDPCGWEGVSCNATTGRVDKVDFSKVEAKGQLRFTLGPAVGRLDALRYMDLADTQLHGSLVEEVTTLRRLELLDVAATSLSGTLPPTVGNLSAVQRLSAHSTSLSGTLPPMVGNLAALHILYMFSTSLSGTLPPTVGNLSALQVLGLSSTSLSGTLPPTVRSLSRL